MRDGGRLWVRKQLLALHLQSLNRVSRNLEGTIRDLGSSRERGKGQLEFIVRAGLLVLSQAKRVGLSRRPPRRRLLDRVKPSCLNAGFNACCSRATDGLRGPWSYGRRRNVCLAGELVWLL